MHRIWRYLWISVVTLIGILLLVITVLSDLNYNQFKGHIENKVSEITGRQLKIEGNLLFNLSLHPLIRVEKVSFANAAWSNQAQMVTFELLQLKIELLPLLEGQLVVDQLLFKDVNLIAEKDADGQANWVLKALQSEKTESTAQSTRSKPFKRLLLPLLKNVQLDNIHLDYSDATTDIKTSVELIALNLSTRAAHEPVRFKANGSINQQPFNFAGHTDFQTEGTSNPGLSLQLDANALGITLSASGKIDQPVTAKGVDIKVSLDAPDLDKTFFSATGKSLEQLLEKIPRPLPLQFSAQLADNEQGYELNTIKLKLADSDLNGRLSLSNQNSSPELQADLFSNRININPLLAKQIKQAKPEKTVTAHKTKALNLPETPLPFELLQQLNGKINYSAKQILAGNFNPEEIKLKADLDKGILNVNQLDLKLDGTPVRSSLFINSREKTPEISFNLDIEQLNHDLITKQLKISQLQKGLLSSSVKLKAKGNNIKSVLLSLEGQSQIQLENVQFKQLINNKKHNITVSSFNLDFTSMNAPLEYTLTGKVDNEAATLSGKLATPISFLDNNPVELSVTATALGTRLLIDGNIKSPLNADNAELDIAFTMPKPKNSLNRLVRILPDLKTENHIPELPVSLHGKLDLSPGRYSINNLQVKIGNNDLSGQVTVNTHGTKPAIKANLASNLLDINSLLPPDSDDNDPLQLETKESDVNRKLFSKEPLPSFDALNNFNATVLYKLKKLSANKQSLDNILLDLRLKNGQLQLKPLSMDFAKGTIKTNLELSSGKIPHLQINTNIKLLDYGRLMTMLGTEEYAKGELNADINLKAKGNSTSALMAGLNGEIRITSEDGLLNNQALKLLSRDLVSLIPFTDNSNRQKLRCAVIQFNINDGIAETHSMVLDTGIISALATGKINLATESLELYVAPRSKRTSVMKLALVPVNISGTLAAPEITPDIAGSTISTTKTAANIGLAVVTGGLSLVAEGMTEKLWSQFIDDTNYCALALAGEKVVPARIRLEETEEDDNEVIDALEDDEF